MADSAGVLAELMSAIAGGNVRIVDLTQALHEGTPLLQLPPEMGQTAPFSRELISDFDERGPWWYWNNFRTGEHTGTHFDAPAHWITGKDHPNNYTDTIPVDQFVARAVVIDVHEQVAANPDFLLEVEHIKAWEAEHGEIPAESWVLMRSDWSLRTDPKEYSNIHDDGAHTPGPSADAVRFLLEERGIRGWGNECVGTDCGQAFTQDPPLPAHNLVHGANRYGLAGLCNLDQLPPTGAVIIAAPLKIVKGSGSPLRVIALVPA